MIAAWRAAEAADLPALAALYADCGRVLGPRVYTPEQVAAWMRFAQRAEVFARYVLEARTTLALDAEGATLGFSGYSLRTVEGCCEAEIRSLYVRADLNRRGIGSRLLDEVMRRARAEGAQRFVAWATPFSLPVFTRAGVALAEAVQADFEGVRFERYRMQGPGR